MTKTRNTYMDLVKAILIYLVILGHSIQLIGYKSTAPFWDDSLFKAIYSFHMQLFIAISGYFTYFSLAKKSILNFLKDRFCNTFIPMLAWCVLAFLVQSLIFKTFSFTDLFSVIELNYWFIWALLLFSFITCYAKKLKVDNIYFWLISIPIVISIPFDMFWYPWIKSIYSYFVIGYLVAKVDLSTIIIKLKKYNTLIFSASIICFIIYPQNAFLYITPSSIFEIKISAFRFITGCLCSISFLLFVYFIYTKLLKQNINSLLLDIGSKTLSLYLVQGLFFYIYTVTIIPRYPKVLHNNFFSFLLSIILFSTFYFTIFLLNKNKGLKKILFG
ncbi:acyltransferase family protein [Dysgonomonas sp.]|uniref:acyltransferase family protein n=1 Tax=Dysgonomonas sp. TaxID=1891233 RepID=UPI003A86F4CF